MTFYQRASIYRPPLCRLLARHNGRAATLEQLAGRSQKSHPLSPLRIDTIAKCDTWDHVPLADMQSFLFACELDFCHPAQMHRADEYLRTNPTFLYLRKSPLWETYYLPLLKQWRNSYGKIDKNSQLWMPLKALLIRLSPMIEKL